MQEEARAERAARLAARGEDGSDYDSSTSEDDIPQTEDDAAPGGPSENKDYFQMNIVDIVDVDETDEESEEEEKENDPEVVASPTAAGEKQGQSVTTSISQCPSEPAQGVGWSKMNIVEVDDDSDGDPEPEDDSNQESAPEPEAADDDDLDELD